MQKADAEKKKQREQNIMKTEMNYGMTKKHKIWVVLLVVVFALLAGCVLAYKSSPQIRLKKTLELGGRYLDELDYESARVYLVEALSIDAACFDAHQGLIQIYVEQEQYEEAFKQYKQALEVIAEADKEELEETIMEALQKGGEISAASKNYDTAIYCYEKVNEICGSMDATESMAVVEKICDIYMILAENAERDKDYLKALECYNNILMWIPDYAGVEKRFCNIYMILAELAMDEGKYEEAIVYCNKVFDVDGESSDAANMLYDIYIILADRANAVDCYDDAIMYCREALAINAQGGEAISRLTDYYLELAKNAEQEGLYDNAEEYYNIILEYMPENQEVLDKKARLEEIKYVYEYEELLRAMMKKISVGKYYDFSDTDIITGEFNDFIKNALTHPVIFEEIDGKYLGVYPGGYIYYGEMENGVRTGKGYWCMGGIYSYNVLYLTWENDAPNGEAVIEIYTNEDMIQKEGEDHYYTIYYVEKVNLVNGVYDGHSIVEQVKDREKDYSKKYDLGGTHKFELTYENGVRVPMNGNVVSYCQNCEFAHTLKTSSHVYKVKF